MKISKALCTSPKLQACSDQLTKFHCYRYSISCNLIKDTIKMGRRGNPIMLSTHIYIYKFIIHQYSCISSYPLFHLLQLKSIMLELVHLSKTVVLTGSNWNHLERFTNIDSWVAFLEILIYLVRDVASVLRFILIVCSYVFTVSASHHLPI